MGRPEQTSLFARAATREADSDECQLCAVPVVPVHSQAGDVIAWRCPMCGDVTKQRMQWDPPQTGECPICLRDFDVLAIHLAKTECGRWWGLGMVADRKRPKWAAFGGGT